MPQLNKLLGHFQQNTGSTFSGQSDQFDQMAAMASRLTGFPIPASVLRKLCVPCPVSLLPPALHEGLPRATVASHSSKLVFWDGMLTFVGRAQDWRQAQWHDVMRKVRTFVGPV